MDERDPEQPTAGEDAEKAAADIRAALADAAARLSAAGAREELLAELITDRRTLFIRREPALRPIGRVWRLGVVLLGVPGGSRGGSPGGPGGSRGAPGGSRGAPGGSRGAPGGLRGAPGGSRTRWSGPDGDVDAHDSFDATAAPVHLYATGTLIRATTPGRTQYVSLSAETRRAYRAAAERGHIPKGETVNFDAPPIRLEAASLAASTGPLLLRDGRVLVRWSAAVTEADARDFRSYLDERVDLLAHPPEGA